MGGELDNEWWMPCSAYESRDLYEFQIYKEQCTIGVQCLYL